MQDFLHAVQSGSTNLWLFIPAAILLGAMHGLEPGHSKTMMAAFIVAIRGTIGQAILLGLSAALSHSLLIWVLAAVALKYGGQWNAETTEPYLQIASAVMIAGLAVWMFWRTRRDVKAAAAHEHHEHGHSHAHDDTKLINTGHGIVKLSVFETGVPPVFRLEFTEHGDLPPGLEYQDAHEAAHALDLQKRFMNRTVTTPQIVLFGLTGGLLPCPAAFTVLLVCLQVKQFTLGFGLVAAFSLGLAITMVTVGAMAAWSVRHAERRFSGFGELMRKAPYVSC